MKNFFAKMWIGLQTFGRFFDRLIPSVVTDFMRNYPGLTVVAVAVGDYFLFRFGTLVG
jgi:hypothetical protein